MLIAAFIRDGLATPDIRKFHGLPDFLAPATIPKFMIPQTVSMKFLFTTRSTRRSMSSKIVTLFGRASVIYILLFFGRLAISFTPPAYARTRLEVLQSQPGPTKFCRGPLCTSKQVLTKSESIFLSFHSEKAGSKL